MVRRKTFYVPTVDHNRYYAEHASEFRYSAKDVRRLKEFIERNMDTLRRAIRAGVLIALGSDAVFTMFGENTRELRWKNSWKPQAGRRTASVASFRGRSARNSS